MRPRSFKTIVGTVAFILSGAALAEGCDGILSHGLRNLNVSQSQGASLAYTHQKNCGIDFSDVSDQQILQAEVEIFGSGKGGANASKSQRATDLRSWCDTNESLAHANASQYAQSHEFYKPAVDAWGSCIALRSERTFIETSIAPDDLSAVLTVSYRGSAKQGPSFYGVEAEGFSCNARGPDGTIQEKSIDAGIELRPQAISISCKRKPAEPITEEGQQYMRLPRGTIAVRTATEPFQLFFPQQYDPSLPEQAASEIKREMAEMQRQLSEVIGRNASLEKELEERSTALRTAQARIEDLDKFKNRFHFGQSKIGGNATSAEQRVSLHFGKSFAQPPILIVSPVTHPNDLMLSNVTNVTNDRADHWFARKNNSQPWQSPVEVHWLAIERE